jgi:signal transduction histidine kinase
MSALAVAPGKYRTPPATAPRALWTGLLLTEFDSSGEILWMNEAARQSLGAVKNVLSTLTRDGQGKAALTFPWGKNWLLTAYTTGEPPARLDQRTARANSQLMEIVQGRGCCNQKLARASEAVEQRRRLASEAKARLRAAANLSEALESERGRIGRELHDNAGQLLVGVLLNLELLERQLHSSTAEALARLERSRKLASLALDQIRRVSHDCNPPEWSGDFRAAVEALVESMAVRSKMQVETHEIDLPQSLRAALKTTLYRVVQEALVNAFRHSEAGCVKIRAFVEEGQAHLVVEDNGRGFDVHSLAAPGSGIGFRSMRQRLAPLGGRVEVWAAPGSGTRVEAFAPWRGNEP